jgi:hypothetical protein
MPPPGSSIYKLPRIGYSRLKETGRNGIAGAANHFLDQDTSICERTAIRLNQSRFAFSTEAQEMPQDTVLPGKLCNCMVIGPGGLKTMGKILHRNVSLWRPKNNSRSCGAKTGCHPEKTFHGHLTLLLLRAWMQRTGVAFDGRCRSLRSRGERLHSTVWIRYALAGHWE